MNYNKIVTEFLLGDQKKLQEELSKRSEKELYELIQKTSIIYARSTELAKFVMNIYLEKTKEIDLTDRIRFMHEEIQKNNSFNFFIKELFISLLGHKGMSLSGIISFFETASKYREIDFVYRCESRLREVGKIKEYGKLRIHHKSIRNNSITKTTVHNILLEIIIERSEGNDLEDLFQWECSLNNWHGMLLLQKAIQKRDRKK